MKNPPDFAAVRRALARTATMLLLAALSAGAWGADAPPASATRPRALLADQHKMKDVDCADCHVEKPPARAASTATCLSCHGKTQDKLAAATHVEPNPHASHQGPQECNVCHRAHKRSVDQCSQCHVTSWTVP